MLALRLLVLRCSSLPVLKLRMFLRLLLRCSSLPVLKLRMFLRLVGSILLLKPLVHSWCVGGNGLDVLVWQLSSRWVNIEITGGNCKCVSRN